MAQSPTEHTNTPTQTSGKYFPDGTALELICECLGSDELRLLHWRRGVQSIGREIKRNGRAYVPINLERSIRNAVRFPARVSRCENISDLFRAIELLVACYTGLSGSRLALTVASRLASWMFDILGHAPTLWLTTSPQSPTNAAIEIFDLIGYRSLRLVNPSRADLCAVPASLRCTLLLDAPRLSGTAENLICSTTRPRAHIIQRGAPLDLFGPKIVCTPRLPDTPWQESDIIQVSLIPSSKRIEIPDSNTAQKIEREFQSRLLAYRINNIGRLRTAKLATSRLSPSLQDLGVTLTAAMIGDRRLEGQIVSALESLNEESRLERSSHRDAIIVEAGLAFCHEEGRSAARTIEVAQQASAIFAGRGIDQIVSAETAGRTLRRLSIPTERLGSAGNGIRFTESTRKLLHEVALSLDVLTLRNGDRRDCGYCEALRKG